MAAIACDIVADMDTDGLAEILADARQAFLDADLRNTSEAWNEYDEAACRYALAANLPVREAYQVIEYGEM